MNALYGVDHLCIYHYCTGGSKASATAGSEGPTYGRWLRLIRQRAAGGRAVTGLWQMFITGLCGAGRVDQAAGVTEQVQKEVENPTAPANIIHGAVDEIHPEIKQNIRHKYIFYK